MYLGLTKYFESFEQLKNKKFNFDFTADQPTNYAIVIPTNNPDLKDDVMGNGKKQLTFYIVSINPWGKDVTNNVDNLEFFQSLKDSVKKFNKQKIFPDLGKNKTVTKVTFTTDGYIESTSTGIGKYQIQGKVEYTEKPDRTNKAPLRF